MIKTNFHTHTDFCDGKNTPEEMVLSAIEKGIQILGFSGHSLYPFSDDWHIPSLKHNEYCKEILSLKEKYADKIQILLGFETDFVPGVDCFSALKKDFKPDYQIGSVHFIFKEAGFFTVDGSVQECLNGIEKVFANDKKAAVCEYLALQRQMLKNGGFELWGHPELHPVCPLRYRSRSLDLPGLDLGQRHILPQAPVLILQSPAQEAALINIEPPVRVARSRFVTIPRYPDYHTFASKFLTCPRSSLMSSVFRSICAFNFSFSNFKPTFSLRSSSIFFSRSAFRARVSL